MFLHASARLFLCTIIIFSLSFNAAEQCSWLGDNYQNPNYDDGSGRKRCQGESYEVYCISTVDYELPTCISKAGENVYEYNIIISVENSNENPQFKNLTHYKELSLLNGYLVTVPKDVYKMTRLNDINITGNKLRKINFNDFLPLSNLKKLNLTNNTLIVIETAEDNVNYSAVLDIDISLNSIEAVPNYFLKRYRELEHLNMSYNMISSIDRHAFEGTVQLKILDLSHNRLKDVGNLFAQLPKLVDINYATPQNLQKLSKLVLDDNSIADVNFTAFFETGIPELSIGGNKIPCYILVRAKYSKYAEKLKRTVTAKTLNFFYKNINGITCEEADNDIKDVTLQLDNANSSLLISSLMRVVESNGKSMDTLMEIVNQNEKKMEKFVESTNDKLMNISHQLSEMQKNLAEQVNYRPIYIGTERQKLTPN